VSVIVQGDRNKPAIVTYHDIGLNGNIRSFLTFIFKKNFYLINWFETEKTRDCFLL